MICEKWVQELPGEFTTFDFLEGIPAPFNFGLSILLNQPLGHGNLQEGKWQHQQWQLCRCSDHHHHHHHDHNHPQSSSTTLPVHLRKMLTLPEKLQTAPALLPMLVEGQKFIDLQDELSARPLKGCTGKS